MPLVPRFEEVDHPYTLWDKRMCIWRDPDDHMQAFLVKSVMTNPFADLRPLVSSLQGARAGESNPNNEFQILVDVLQFKVEEITVKVSEDGIVSVEAIHEEKQDEHGFISRHFIRTYELPKCCNFNLVQSKLSFDGVLTISAPKSSDVDYRMGTLVREAEKLSFAHREHSRVNEGASTSGTSGEK